MAKVEAKCVKWSRLSGGSGAPMWTLYAAGLNPRAFRKTEAALVQNTYENPALFPKMIWSTNYARHVCQTIFTLFWAGLGLALGCQSLLPADRGTGAQDIARVDPGGECDDCGYSHNHD